MADASDDPFSAAYRAYLESIKEAWAEVDIDELVSDRADQKFAAYQSAGSVGTIGTIWCIATAGGCLGSLGSIGTVAVKPDE